MHNYANDDVILIKLASLKSLMSLQLIQFSFQNTKSENDKKLNTFKAINTLALSNEFTESDVLTESN